MTPLKNMATTKIPALLSTPYGRLCLWLLIAIYVAALPYAIILFNLLRSLLTLPVVKALPMVLFLLLSLAYLRFCREHNRGYQIVRFVTPVCGLLACVVMLESNPIKYLHVPEYALLTCLVYLALKREGAQLNTVVVAAAYASLLGVVDEVHHGIHADRYFGWKDMVINAVGSAIGGLSIVALSKSNFGSLTAFSNTHAKALAPLAVLMSSGIVTCYSIVMLFEVARHASFYPSYPFVLMLLNLVSITFIAITISLCKDIRRHQQTELLVFFPMILVAAVQCLIVFAYFQGHEFR